MILSFKVSNFKSFNKVQELNFVTQPRQSGLENNYAEVLSGKKVLKSSVIFGANASGKSNLVKALAWFRNYVLNSFQPNHSNLNGENILFDEFLLDHKNKTIPLSFELDFTIKKQYYKFSFSSTKKKIVKESLELVYQSKKSRKIYERKESSLKLIEENQIRKSAQNILKENTLFLTVLAASGDDIAEKILNKIRNITIINSFENNTYTRENYPVYKSIVDSLMIQADFGVKKIDIKNEDISAKEIEEFMKIEKDIPPRIMTVIKNTPYKIKKYSILTTHKAINKDNQSSDIQFDLEKESDGTQRTFALAGLMANILESGKTLVVDELDAHLHPSICQFILLQFHLKNPNNAQLLFTSHSTSLLDKDLLRRDQIWFTEKDDFGATELYSLAGLEERKDVDYAQRYLEGRYGALPYISLLENYQDQNA